AVERGEIRLLRRSLARHVRFARRHGRDHRWNPALAFWSRNDHEAGRELRDAFGGAALVELLDDDRVVFSAIVAEREELAGARRREIECRPEAGGARTLLQGWQLGFRAVTPVA